VAFTVVGTRLAVDGAGLSTRGEPGSVRAATFSVICELSPLRPADGPVDTS